MIVITEDGTRLRCTISALGREEAPRWIVMDSDANQYIGPLVESGHSPDAVQKLISSWWATHPKDTVER